MSCCGKARSEPLPAREAVRRTVEFEYVGRTGLRTVGPVSGISYRFDRPGSRVTVDGRDRMSLAGVPVLRQIRA